MVEQWRGARRESFGVLAGAEGAAHRCDPWHRCRRPPRVHGARPRLSFGRRLSLSADLRRHDDDVRHPAGIPLGADGAQRVPQGAGQDAERRARAEVRRRRRSLPRRPLREARRRRRSEEDRRPDRQEVPPLSGRPGNDQRRQPIPADQRLGVRRVGTRCRLPRQPRRGGAADIRGEEPDVGGDPRDDPRQPAVREPRRARKGVRGGSTRPR